MARRKSVQPQPATPMEDMKYRARSALHTLAEADDIKRNKPLMREVKKLHGRMGKAMGAGRRARKEPM
jgi:hypothetical protein